MFVTAQLRPLFGLGATFLLASCATLQVGSDYDRSANFSTYHTFTLMQREHRGILRIVNPLRSGSTSSMRTHTGQCGTAGQRRTSLERISSSPQSLSATP